jgi:hypothetical protein
MYHGCGEMDHGGEALVGFVSPHGDAFDLLQLTDEALDQMPPLIHLLVDGERRNAARVPSYDDLGAAFVEIGDNAV